MRVQYHARHGTVPLTSASIQVLCEVEVLIELFSSKNLSDGVYTNKETSFFNNSIVTNMGRWDLNPGFYNEEEHCMPPSYNTLGK